MNRESTKPTIRETFHCPNGQLSERHGQRFQVVRHITEPDANYDADVLPMYEVRFEDGHVSGAFSEEVETDESPWTDYETLSEQIGAKRRDIEASIAPLLARREELRRLLQWQADSDPRS